MASEAGSDAGLDGLLRVRGALLALLVVQRGDDVGADTPCVLALEHQRLRRVVHAALVASVDLKRRRW